MNKASPTLVQRAADYPGRIGKLLLATAPLVLLSAAGCEVQWGGIQVKAGEPEYERPAALEAPHDTFGELPPLAMPAGPVLFHVRRADASGRAIIEPVTELSEGELLPVGPQSSERAEEYAAGFLERYYQPDQAYVLLREGSRVGTFYVGSPDVSGSGVCLRLRAEGQLELRPRADTLSEFLAWPVGTRSGADSLQEAAYRDDMTTLSPVLARRGVNEAGIEGRWRFQRPADLRALQVGTGRLGFAATFMVGDSLGPGSPVDSAGMVFLVADYSPAVGYFPLYFDAAWYGPGGKRALRWLDSADLVGDSEAEWLLQAYGDVGSWYELIGLREAAMTRIWSSRRPVCEAQEPAAPSLPGGG